MGRPFFGAALSGCRLCGDVDVREAFCCSALVGEMTRKRGFGREVIIHGWGESIYGGIPREQEVILSLDSSIAFASIVRMHVHRHGVCGTI